ncbi:hypothetical protein B9479_006229 [Cryptococcus floricola]|uniref:ferric-chelate reductase (NADPH) n=1 Tax=Cryptococcus floricola TaxID=2591691 RepID=A0A5D3ASG0_9TREE|nr:hypothetical protein B9479_006229 [Cryptococcus floricola]
MSATVSSTAAVLAKTTVSAAKASLKAKIAAEKKIMTARSLHMVYDDWIGIAILFGICWFFIIPRFIARVRAPTTPRGHSLARGWFLRKGTDKSIDGTASETSSQTATDVGATTTPPTHVKPLISYIPGGSTLFFYRPFQNLRWGFKSFAKMYDVYLLALYLLLVCFTIAWRSPLVLKDATTGYVADYKRSGYVAIAQFPLCIALGVRNNIFGYITGKAYDRLKIYHKVTGRIMFAATIWHVACYLYKWVHNGVFYKNSAKQYAKFGWLAFGCFLIIMFTSLPWVRNRCYGIFKAAHIIGFILMLVGLGFHVDREVSVPITVSSGVVYGVSMICSLTKTRLASAEIVAHPGSDVVTVTIPALKSGWRAGQHVRLRVPATGGVHFLEGHPFTIASAADSEGAVLMIKNTGDWTRKLYKLAAKSAGDAEAPGAPLKTTVIVEGPYGGMGNTLPESFSSVLAVAGGSGITHSLGLASELIMAAPSGAVRPRTVDLVWMVRTTAMARPLLPTIHKLVNEARDWEVKCLASKEQTVQPTALRVHIHVTQAANAADIDVMNFHSVPALENEKVSVDAPLAPSADTAEGNVTPPALSPADEVDPEKLAYMTNHPGSNSQLASTVLSGVVIHPGRPQVGTFVHGIVDETISRHTETGAKANGVCVAVCGPDELLMDILKAGWQVEQSKQKACGGLEVEEESFGF